MLCISEDDYSDSEHVHTGKYAAPRPHIQADLYKLGREIQRILMEEPDYLLNLCKLREKYEFFYGKPLDKLGYSKLVDCAYALPEPITTRNCRPNGVALLLMRPMRESCKAFQRGQCGRTPDQCEHEHECDLCGYPTHGASECVDEGAPDTKPVQSYTHCCLRSKCVGDIHNPDVYVPDADDVILADLSAKASRITVGKMLEVKDMYRSPPAFKNPELECVAGRQNKRPAPPRPRVAPALDERQLKIRAFYAHFIAWLKNRYREFQDWPRDREDFSFEWESYLSGNREMRQTVVALVDFSPSAALVYLSTEANELVTIRNLTQLDWNPEKIADLLEVTGAAPPPSRRWSQSSSQWHDGSSGGARTRNPAPRPWASQIPDPPFQETTPSEPAPVVEQKVVFTISKANVIKDPPASSMVWRPDSPERYTSKIPIPTATRFLDDNDEDEDKEQSRAWSTNWRPKTADYVGANEFDDVNDSRAQNLSNTAGHEGTYTDYDEEEGALLEDDETAAGVEADDPVVDSSYEIQHEYYEQVVQSGHQPMLHDAVSHMDNIANAYASDSDSSSGELSEGDFDPSPSVPEPPTSSERPSGEHPSDWTEARDFVPEKPSVEGEREWTEPRGEAPVVNSSFSALFGDAPPSQRLLPEQPFVAELCHDKIEAPEKNQAMTLNIATKDYGTLPLKDQVPSVTDYRASMLQVPDLPMLSPDAPNFVPDTDFAPAEPQVTLSHSAPEFIPPVLATSDSDEPKLSPFASEFIASPLTTGATVNDDSEATTEAKHDSVPPRITIDNKMVVGDGLGQNYRRMNDIVRRTEFGFCSDVSVAEVVDDLKRLGLASGASPNLAWNSDRVEELATLSNPRSSGFEPSSHQVISDQNEEFLKNLLYQAILGTTPVSSEEMDLFIHECLRLQHAGVESVLGGMRSLWVASRSCSSSGSALFQTPHSRPVITNEAYSLKPLAHPTHSSNSMPRLAPSTLEDFLQEARLQHWREVLENEEIGFELLPELTDSDLVDLGMSNVAERQRFHDTVVMIKS